MKTVLRITLLITLSPLWLIALFAMFVGALMSFAFTGRWGFLHLSDIWN